MPTTAVAPTPLSTDPLQPARRLLDAAREARAEADAAERRLLQAAAAWATMHEVDVGTDALTAAYWSEGGVPLAGDGAPTIAEFCVAEFAAALGMSTRAGRQLLGDAAELHHRLPRLWERVGAGDLPAWRARRVAQQTLDLPEAGAAFVDRHVHEVAQRVGPAQLDRLVEEARVRHDPQRAEELRRERAEARHLDIATHDVRPDGTVPVEGLLDLLDALDLERAIGRGAEELLRLGSLEPLAVRRSLAAGALARGDLALDLASVADDHQRPTGTRGLVVHVHLPATAVVSIRGAAARDPGAVDLARVDGVPGFVTAEQVRQWCGRPEAKVLVRPVVDADQHVHVDSYEVPDRLREITGLRDRTCVFPWCSRPAHRCDRDHVVPDGENGATCSCNVAALCRRHHRLKTHGRWRYLAVEPGLYLWTGPTGFRFLRDHTGTREVDEAVSPLPVVRAAVAASEVTRDAA